MLLLLLALLTLAGDLMAQVGLTGGLPVPYRKFPKESSLIGAHWDGVGSFGVTWYMTPKPRQDQAVAMDSKDAAILYLSAPEGSYTRVYFHVKDNEKREFGLTNGGATVNCFTYTSHYAFRGLTLGGDAFAWSILTPSLGWGLYQFVFNEDGDFTRTGGSTLTELGDENKDLNFGYSVGLSTDFLWQKKIRITFGGEMHTIFKSISMTYLPAPLIADIFGKRPRARFVNLFVRLGLQ